MELHLKNPDALPYWKAKLVWMMDNEPERLQQMFRAPKELMAYLDEQTARAAAAEMRETKAGTPKDVAQEIAMSLVAPEPEEYPEIQMPEAQRRMMLAWADRIPERTHVTTV